MAVRRIDPQVAREAWLAAWDPLRTWIGALGPDEIAAASVLSGWSVGDLAVHLARVADSVAALAPAARGTRPLGIAAYLDTYRGVSADIAQAARDGLGGPDRTPEDLRRGLDASLDAARARLDAVGVGDPVVQARRGPIRLGDFLATRVIEVVVHADDCSRSLPEREPVPSPDSAVGLTVRTLLGVLAARVPGRSVEVRVPPFGAVQCLTGPSHARGTPPNVVESAAMTWIRLAAGRTAWTVERAAARVSASGERADLAEHLPLL